MSDKGCRVFVVLFTMLILGCTTVPKGTGESVAVRAVQIYGPGQLPQGTYETIKPLTVGSWRLGFSVPEYRTEEEAMTALQTEAAKLGANGLINVACNQENRALSSWQWGSNWVFICRGNAVRVRTPVG